MANTEVEFVETDSDTGELPDEWEEIYYAEQHIEVAGSDFTLVKALYEHVPLSIKVAVYPDEKVPLNDNPTHRIKLIQPLYNRIGNRVYIEKANEIESVIATITPYYNPDGEYESENNEFGIMSDYVKFATTIEGRFDWEVFSDSTLSKVKTLKQYPLDYSYLIDTHERPSTAADIEEHESGLLPQPIDGEIYVCEDHDGSNTVCLRGGSINDIKDVHSHFDIQDVDLSDLDVGTELAHVKLRIENPYGPYSGDWRYKIEAKNFTDAGRRIQTLSYRVKKRIVDTLHSEASRLGVIS